MPTQPTIEAFFDEPTNTVSYLVADAAGGAAVVIDPVLDFDLASGTADIRSADRLLAAAAAHGWRIEMVLETHAHADHLSAAPYIKAKTGAAIGIGEHIRDVQKIFRPMFAFDDLVPDGSDFDRLFADGERLRVGGLDIEVMHVPGHTPADVAYRIGDAVFVGDTLFMPDSGSARCDFPGGDARVLYRSIRRVLALPPTTRLHMCHDYQPGGREPAWVSTVAEQKAQNVHVHDGVDEDSFVALRSARDQTLGMPTLLLPAVQVNVRAGHFPPPEANGVSYLKIPLNLL
ncbi:MAG: MBL fold metallo-hydrolase [Sphingomonadaceae bacterium]|nr:MBL fold metallo-hydrolase [Sphingomonadaceae bacterium]